MPVSVFKDIGQSESVTMSQITGVQLTRLVVLATRLEPKGKLALPVIRDLIETEVSRLTLEGVFTFNTTG